MSRQIIRQTVNTGVLLGVLWANGMAGAGTISGESIGVIANRYRSAFLPADYVFGIWGLIYLSLAAFTLYQALPSQRSNPTIERLGASWAVNGILNVAWIVTFSFSRFGLALVLMVALLVNLIWIHERVGFDRKDLSLRDRVLVAYPFGLYLAWICVALIANTFQLLTYLSWGGWTPLSSACCAPRPTCDRLARGPLPAKMNPQQSSSREAHHAKVHTALPRRMGAASVAGTGG